VKHGGSWRSSARAAIKYSLSLIPRSERANIKKGRPARNYTRDPLKRFHKGELSKDSNTGYTGVCLRQREYKSGTFYFVRAIYFDENKERQRAEFSVTKYGKAEAIKKGVEFRKKGINKGGKQSL
jgi:hypothetical protein